MNGSLTILEWGFSEGSLNFTWMHPLENVSAMARQHYKTHLLFRPLWLVPCWMVWVARLWGSLRLGHCHMRVGTITGCQFSGKKDGTQVFFHDMRVTGQ